MLGSSFTNSFDNDFENNLSFRNGESIIKQKSNQINPNKLLDISIKSNKTYKDLDNSFSVRTKSQNLSSMYRHTETNNDGEEVTVEIPLDIIESLSDNIDGSDIDCVRNLSDDFL